MNFFTGSALWQLIRQSDFVSILVLLILLGMSIACWTIFFYKLNGNRVKHKHINGLLSQLQHAKNIHDLVTLHSNNMHTVGGYFLMKILKLIEWYGGPSQVHAVSHHAMESLEGQLMQQVDDMVEREEAGLSVLSTSASVAPLLGLFGTVWGLIHAFIGISQSQTADIAAVAPGIAQALTTTLAGLLVAIPAFILFNILQSKNRAFEASLMRVADYVHRIVQKTI